MRAKRDEQRRSAHWPWACAVRRPLRRLCSPALAKSSWRRDGVGLPRRRERSSSGEEGLEVIEAVESAGEASPVDG